MPPSPAKTPEPTSVTVPRPTEGGTGDEGKGRGDGSGNGSGSGSGSGSPEGTGPPAPAVTTTSTLPTAVADGAVRDVVAVSGDGQVSLSWSAPQSWKPVTGYSIAGTPGVSPIDLAASETRVTVTGLTNGTEYVFTVIARSDDGNGEPGRSAPVTPAAAAPDAPSNVAATAGDGQVTVTWDPPRRGRFDGFDVQIVPTNGSTLPANPAAADQRQITITGLSNGVTYYATVRARNGARSGTATSSATFVPVGRPGRPSGVNVANTGGGELTVSWTDAPANGSSVTGYTVSAPGLSPITVPGDRRSAVFRGLTIGGTHTFTVVATNSVGDGPIATSSPAVVESLVPGAPSGVSAAAGDGSVTVTWSAAPANGSVISAYRVRNLTTGTTDTVPAAQLEQTVSSLSNGTAYTFEVQAVATNGAAGQPSAATTAVTPVGQMLAPTNVVATVASPVSITVTFDAPAMVNGNPIDHWVVTPDPPMAPVTTTTGSATIANLVPNTTYTASVVAVATSGATSPAATSAAVTTPLDMPAQVTGLRVTSQTINSVRLVWDAMPYAAYYVIDPGDGSTQTQTVTTTIASWNPPNYYDESFMATVTAYSSSGAAAPAASVWYLLPPNPADVCGGNTGKICM